MTDVAKVVIRVEGFSEPTYLMSRKKAKGTPRHGKLEFLGGGIEGDTPLEGLRRELEEEEKSGVLARKVEARQPPARLVKVDATQHYIFELELAMDEYIELRHAKGESIGFKVVPESFLRSPNAGGQLTPRTKEILMAIGLV